MMTRTMEIEGRDLDNVRVAIDAVMTVPLIKELLKGEVLSHDTERIRNLLNLISNLTNFLDWSELSDCV